MTVSAVEPMDWCVRGEQERTAVGCQRVGEAESRFDVDCSVEAEEGSPVIVVDRTADRRKSQALHTVGEVFEAVDTNARLASQHTFQAQKVVESQVGIAGSRSPAALNWLLAVSSSLWVHAWHALGLSHQVSYLVSGSWQQCLAMAAS